MNNNNMTDNNNNQRNYNNNRKNGKFSSRISIPWLRKKNFEEKKNIISDEKKTLNDKLDQEIRDFVDYIKSTEEEKKMRNYVIEKLNNIVTRLWPDATIQVYGSFPLDLYLPVSDIDIVINGGNKYTEGPIYKLADELERNNFYDQMNLISTAKIPIIKVSEKLSKCNVDITFDHSVNGDNLQLLVHQYSSEFPELKPLLLILKYVLYQRNLNVPFQGGLGSFALLILLRHFLCYYLGKRGFGPTAKFYQENNENSEKSEIIINENENHEIHPNKQHLNQNKDSIKQNGHKDGLENLSKSVASSQKTSKRKKNKRRNGVSTTDLNQNSRPNSKESNSNEDQIQNQIQNQMNGDYHYKYNSNNQSFDHAPNSQNGQPKMFNQSNASQKNGFDSQRSEQIHNGQSKHSKNNFQSHSQENITVRTRKEIAREKKENKFDTDSNKSNKKRNQNKRPNLGELLVNFFKYFGEFNFVSNGVTADGTFSKEERGCVDQKIPWKLFVEDPISPSNNLGAPTYHVLTIRDFFKDCHDVLTDENAKSLTLLTRIIVLDPHLDKYRAQLGYQFGDKSSQTNNNNNNGGSGNSRFNNQYYRHVNSNHNNYNQKSSNPLY